jgi:hypothetical protein
MDNVVALLKCRLAQHENLQGSVVAAMERGEAHVDRVDNALKEGGWQAGG